MLIGDAWRCTVYGIADALTGGRRQVRECAHECLACAVAEEIAHPTPDPEPQADIYVGQVPRPVEWPR